MPQHQQEVAAKLVIIGGGAAGMFAERGVPCVLVERKARLGSKVLMTANGRCNFAKDISPEQFLKDISRGGIAAPCAVVANSFSILAENVLLATGGASYPKTGSVGDGQRFAQALGHRLVPYRPGLIGLETRDEKVTRLAGRRFEDGAAKVFDASGKAIFEYRGEIDCESFGLSGAAIYNAQRFIEHWMRERDVAARLSAEVSFGRKAVASIAKKEKTP